ncbi:MAG: taurine dioxygenase [Gammaproteobacteria bacterium]|jgi:taurine dioxygenase
MSYQHLEVRPIAGAIGAEIHGVNLAALDDETFNEIHAVWLEHLVVFFRDQDISAQQQLDFALRFGDIHFHPFMRGMDDHPEVLEIVKEPSDPRTFGSVWHTDQMFNPKPAKATMLYAKETPSAGGDTMFANMYAAYDHLSAGMQTMVGDLKTFNVGDRFKHNGGKSRAERYGAGSNMGTKVKDPGNVQTESAHPLVRTHPETGRKALYIGSHTQGLDGFEETEADPLLNYLREHATRPEFTCRFRWQVGSMAIWDNRCVQHRALADYPNERRRMHRITIAGDEPF